LFRVDSISEIIQKLGTGLLNSAFGFGRIGRFVGEWFRLRHFVFRFDVRFTLRCRNLRAKPEELPFED